MFKPQYKQLINVDGIELKPSDVCKSRYIVTASLFAFSAIASRFSQLLKCDNRYGSILPRITLPATLLCLASYKQCSTRLLKMLHKHCNMDMLEVLLIYLHSPSGAAHPRDRACVSIKPLAAVLQPINTPVYTQVYTSIHRYSQVHTSIHRYTQVYSGYITHTYTLDVLV